MSKILKHRENIFNFLTTKSCFNNVIDKNFIKDFIDNDLCLYPIALLAIFSAQIKKNKIKQYHTFHITGALVLMLIMILINENKKFYEEKYGIEIISDFSNKATIFIYESVSQNVKTIENTLGVDSATKIQKKISAFLYEKLLSITENNITDNKLKINKTDIIKYKFDDKEIITKKYSKLTRINKEQLNEYIDKKYGSIGECVVLFGWILGMGDMTPKTLDCIIKTGNSLGILIKITHDFANLENEIKMCNLNSYNFIVNYGIHECFKLYDINKIKFIEGCMINDLYCSSIKELIEKIEKTYEKCLKNTELELVSKYSSFDS